MGVSEQKVKPPARHLNGEKDLLWTDWTGFITNGKKREIQC